MLNELLKHSDLGDTESLGFVLFRALTPGKEQKLEEVRKFCVSNMFSINRSIKGIFDLLEFTSFATIQNNTITLNPEVFNPKDFSSPKAYFKEPHFFKSLFNCLLSTDLGREIFNADNVKFSHIADRYYIKSHLIRLNFFPIRNLLLRLSFLEPDITVNDHLYIASEFTGLFKDLIAKHIESDAERKKLTLEHLKESLERKNEMGQKGESFALAFEKNRLNGHSRIAQIELISETFVNAGYDLKSFDTLDSFVNDRFIEIKAYSGEIAFYWSKNEVQIAKKFGYKYWLYLVDVSSINRPSYSPKMFQNPYSKIFESEFWRKEIESWRISIEE